MSRDYIHNIELQIKLHRRVLFYLFFYRTLRLTHTHTHKNVYRTLHLLYAIPGRVLSSKSEPALTCVYNLTLVQQTKYKTEQT